MDNEIRWPFSGVRSKSEGVNEQLVEALREGNGILILRQHPRLKHAIRHARIKGDLKPVLRGIYAAAEAADTFEVRCRALWAKDPDAVLVGISAARVHGITVKGDSEVVHAASRRVQGSRRGFVLTRRVIAVDHIHEDKEVRATVRELTLLDLARSAGAEHGSALLSEGLRAGSVLAALIATLNRTRHRRGNGNLRRLLLDVRDEPWSAAEVAGHQALRKRRIKGWGANFEVPTPEGPRGSAKIDIALPQLSLGFEIDGFEHHGTSEAFHHDRGRDVDLAKQSWHIIRVSARWVLDHPDEFAAFVAEMIVQRKLLLGLQSACSRPHRRRRRHRRR